MKIINKSETKETVRFGDIPRGECFEFIARHGQPWMKTFQSDAVSLKTGSVIDLGGGEEVISVNYAAVEQGEVQ